MNCIFCDIANNKVEAFKVFEDDKVLAFLDHRPVREGHCMVIPKIHIDNFIDTDDELASHITVVANRIGRKVTETLKPKRVGIVVSGFGIPHAHMHVIPMWDEHDITSSTYANVKNSRVIFSSEHVPVPSTENQIKVQNLLRVS